MGEQPGGVFTVGVWIAAVSFCRAAWRARIERLPYRLKGGGSVIPENPLSSPSLPASWRVVFRVIWTAPMGKVEGRGRTLNGVEVIA